MKFKGLFLLLVVCLFSFSLSGCEGNENAPRVKKEESGRDKNSDEKKDDSGSGKSESNKAVKSGEELKKEYGQVMVTEISGGVTKDFYFTEDYEAFSERRKQWILDLNGNTVVVTKPITISSYLTITNGKIIIACEPGFRVDAKTDAINPTSSYNVGVQFSGKEHGPLTVSVYDGVGVYSCKNMRFDDCDIEVQNGVFQIPDTKSGWPDQNPFYDGEFFNCRINVYGGCFLMNGDKETKVDFSPYNSSIYVYENGIGVVNSGVLDLKTFEKAEVHGGGFIVNQAGGLLNASLDYKPVYIQGGIGIANEGIFEGSFASIVTEGTAVFNKGTCNGRVSASTTPLTTYKGALVVNDQGGNMEISGTLIVYTGEGAVGLDNGSICSYKGKIFMGLPYKNDRDYYEVENSVTYNALKDSFSAFFDGNENVLIKCRGIVNRDGAKLLGISASGDSAIGMVNLNSTEITEGSYLDKTIGIYNMTGGTSTEEYYVYIHGEDAIGIYNSSGAKMSLDSKLMNRETNIYAEPDLKHANGSTESDMCLASLKNERERVKSCIGIVNKSNDFSVPVEITICGDDCIGFLNEGHCGETGTELLEKRFPFFEACVTEMYGRNNTGLSNSGTLGIVSEDKGRSINIKVFGSDSTCIENGGKITSSVANSFAGNNIKGIVNSGNIESYDNLSQRFEDEGLEMKDITGIENTGTIILAKDIVTYFSCEKFEGKTYIKNGSGGTMEWRDTVIWTYDKDLFWEAFIDNYGKMKAHTLSLNSTVVKDLLSNERRRLLRNSGMIEAENIYSKVTHSGVMIVENSGEITVSNSMTLSVEDTCENSSIGINTGTIKGETITFETRGKENESISGDGQIDPGKSFRDFFKDSSVEKETSITVGKDDASSTKRVYTLNYDETTHKPIDGKMKIYDLKGNFIEDRVYKKDSKGYMHWVKVE